MREEPIKTISRNSNTSPDHVASRLCLKGGCTNTTITGPIGRNPVIRLSHPDGFGGACTLHLLHGKATFRPASARRA
jgi:hypothetical protein